MSVCVCVCVILIQTSGENNCAYLEGLMDGRTHVLGAWVGVCTSVVAEVLPGMQS